MKVKVKVTVKVKVKGVVEKTSKSCRMSHTSIRQLTGSESLEWIVYRDGK